MLGIFHEKERFLELSVLRQPSLRIAKQLLKDLISWRVVSDASPVCFILLQKFTKYKAKIVNYWTWKDVRRPEYWNCTMD